MPDELRSPIKHHLVLHRIDPEQGHPAFLLAHDRARPVRGRAAGPQLGADRYDWTRSWVEVFADELDARAALETIAKATGTVAVT